ncbi:hypothetical protein LTR36_001270 [Oleoguttula mirabilis]|uniref:Uncharacterized protein n=1 Tax=Oleoguttula mirabilis TaxID=1507867 RepID=A0AAV9JR82_9PEZI|nr:hypothetical protein LTR36_001270 [Oleoguttula mirabilis]
MATDSRPASASMPAEHCDTTTEIVTTSLAAHRLPTEHPNTTSTPVIESSPLLQLPSELRLLIFDALVEPLVQKPEHFDVYMLPSEWPKTELGTYTSTLLTCKQLYAEAKDHFETHYLSKITIYFYDPLALRNFTTVIARIAKLEPKYNNIQICISGCPTNAWFFTSTRCPTNALFRTALFNTVPPADDTDKEHLDARLAVGELKGAVSVFTDTQPHVCFSECDGGPICDPDDRRGNVHARAAQRIGEDGIETLQHSASARHTMYTQMTAPVNKLRWSSWMEDYDTAQTRESRARCDDFLKESSVEIEYARFASLDQPFVP